MLKIKEEFKRLIPELTPEEFKQLETNCMEEGIREKIITWNGYIIDGHNRYHIAQKWDLEYETESKYFDNENEAKIWMILNQFGRRNLGKYQRSILAIQLQEEIALTAKENSKLSGMMYGKGCQNSDKPINPIDTKKELAKIADVSHDTIVRVKKIEEKATPEVKEKLATGEISINQAYTDIKKQEKKEEFKQKIQEQIKDIETGKLPELKGFYEVISVDPPWPYEGDSKNITTYDPNGRRVSNPYPEMNIEQIKNIDLPLAEDSIVFLWTTHKFIKDAFDILDFWNLDYKATLVWDKEKIGMGAWFRMQCEFCLVGIKGKPYWENTYYRDILREPRREHSRKPDSFFDMVDKITVGRKLEYFSREARLNWEVYGNDTEKF